VFAALEYTIRSIVLEISAPQLFEILSHPIAEILFGGIGKNDVGFSLFFSEVYEILTWVPTLF
jgi:hypothetical protein